MDTAGRIKILRMLNGYTQEAIAALIGISRPSVVIWESGKHPPAPEFVIRISTLVGVEPGYISYGSPRISGGAWIPTPPERPQNFSSFIRDMETLFPTLLDENGFSAARFSRLGDGGIMFLIGRGNEYSSLLLARESLADCFVRIFDRRDAVEMGSFEKVTVDSFGEDELSFIVRHAADFRIDYDGIWQALAKARPGGRIKEDTLFILFTSFAIVMGEYEISGDDLMKLSNFFVEKYRGLPPLQKVSSGEIQTEIRALLESLGCRGR
jgi:transcriptional regulator with XRE-family HTH domain